MNLAEELTARGLVEHSSADVETILSTPRTVYLGVDPSSDSMQAGNLLVVLMMKRLAQAGHKIILLVGGGTGMIGDPRESGERPLSDPKVVARNKKALKAQMQRIVGTKVTVVDNADWLLKVKLIDFLRDIGKHFTVNELTKRDIIRRRLDDPNDSISYTEFAYSLLQGYDYLVLNKKYGVNVQIGASDQWTNILSGVELIRRKEGKEAFALVTPLVTDANGKKFGKSEGNAVWLDANKTSPFQFYQFWLNQPDEMVGKYLKYYTFMPVMEIDMLMELHGRNPGRREAQKMLAHLVTELVHGEEAAARAVSASEAVFGGSSLADLSPAELAAIRAEVSSIEVAVGMTVVDALVAASLAGSKGEARRLIEGKGVTVNGETVEAVDATLTTEQFSGKLALLRRGKQTALLSLA